MSNQDEPRPCERHCPNCDQWKHHSRFKSRKRNPTSIDGGTVEFDRLCRDCQQKVRNERKNEDRPKAIIEDRAAAHARTAGATKQFFMVNMNYRALIPIFRAMMTPEGLCLCCGHRFTDQRDIQIEHKEPPRHRHDWARRHARNLSIACQSCNGTKLDKPYAQWLDEQEQCRLSNEVTPSSASVPVVSQMSLFEQATT